MSDHLALLERAHEALLDARPQDSEQAMVAFEELCRSTPPNAETMRACHDRIAALRELARASLEGVASARLVFAEAIESAAQLCTYDASGARAMRLGRRPQGTTY